MSNIITGKMKVLLIKTILFSVFLTFLKTDVVLAVDPQYQPVNYDCEYFALNQIPANGVDLGCPDDSQITASATYQGATYCCVGLSCANPSTSCPCQDGSTSKIGDAGVYYYCPVDNPPTTLIENPELINESCRDPIDVTDPLGSCVCPGGTAVWPDPNQNPYCIKYESSSSNGGDDYESYLPFKNVDAWELINGIAISETQFFGTMFNFIFPIGIVFGVAGIVMAGYTYMTSEGRPDKVKDANERLTHAVLGLLFIVLSLAILRLIINTLFDAGI